MMNGGDFRMMFDILGQRISLPDLEDNSEPVDVALLWGPTLPKLVGRLCYSHFQRRKTVAVLEPDHVPSNPPRVPTAPTGVWRDGPEEPYWEDRAVRRWVRQSGDKASRDAYVRGFDLILPCADGVSGKLSGGELCGSQLWQEKAQTIKDLLAGRSGSLEREFDLTTPWSKVSLILPRGVKRAFRAAFLHRPALAADEQAKSSEASLSGDEKKQYEEWLRKLVRIPRDHKALLRQHVAGKLCDRARDKSAAKSAVEQLPLGGEETKAARTPNPQSRNVLRFDQLVANAKLALKKELGNDAVWDEE